VLGAIQGARTTGAGRDTRGGMYYALGAIRRNVLRAGRDTQGGMYVAPGAIHTEECIARWAQYTERNVLRAGRNTQRGMYCALGAIHREESRGGARCDWLIARQTRDGPRLWRDDLSSSQDDHRMGHHIAPRAFDAPSRDDRLGRSAVARQPWGDHPGSGISISTRIGNSRSISARIAMAHEDRVRRTRIV
jgi:hypothetical protein